MKIDTSKIIGYEEMSAEDKIKVLESIDTFEPDYSGYIKKDVFDKTASELAEKKKQLQALLTEEELSKQREKEERDELEAKYNQLLHDSTVSKNKAKLLAMSYDEALAEETAEAMANGDMETVFLNQKKHLESFEKRVRAETLKDTPKPVGDGDLKTMTLSDFRKLSTTERIAYAEAYPQEYKELYGGN